MKILSFLLLTLSPTWSAPLTEKEDLELPTKGIYNHTENEDGVHNHIEDEDGVYNYTEDEDGVYNHSDQFRDGRGANLRNNLFKLGDISVSGNVEGSKVSIGSRVDIQLGADHQHSSKPDEDEDERPLPSACKVQNQEAWIPLLDDPCNFEYNGKKRTLSGPNCDGSPKEKIGVVGAGMAGLTLSWILQHIGHEVVLLEASDRIGGRVHTHYGNGWYGDLGPMRFPDFKTQPLTHFIVRKFLGNDAFDFFTNNNQGTGSYFNLNGKYFSSEDYVNEDQRTLKEIYGMFGIDDSNPLLRNETTNTLINPSDVLKYRVLESEKETWRNQVCANPESLESYLRRRLTELRGPQNLINVWSTLILLRAFLPLSLWSYIWDDPEVMEENLRVRRNHGDVDAQFKEIRNGTEELPKAIFQNITSHENFSYRLNSKVTRSTILDNGLVKLHMKGIPDNESFNKVVIATTSKAASLIKYDPILPCNKTYALTSFHYLNSVKVFLHFTKAFWDEPNKIPKIPYGCPPNDTEPCKCGGTGTTDLSMRSIYYPSNTLHGTALLVSYVWGDGDAGRLTAIPEDALIQRALDDLAEIHGDVVYETYSGENIIKKWLEDEYVGGGAFPFGQPFHNVHLLEALRMHLPPVYFAGEYTEKHFHGWIQSAVASACRVSFDMFGKSAM